MSSTRRALLTGAGAATLGLVGLGALVEHDVLPGRPLAHRLLGLDGPPGHVPDVTPGRRVVGTVASDTVDVDPGYVLCYPPGASPGDRLPTVVLLHGAHSSAAGKVDSMGLDRFLAASGHQMVLAAVDGGDHSYWHRRSDGQDAGAMVLDDFVPMLRDSHLEPRAFWGWSMGGFGALSLSATDAGHRVGGALAVSPALWTDWGEVPADAFDTEDQYDAGMALVRGSRAWTRVDCGTGDPFYRHDLEICADLDVETHWSPGAHDTAYWTRVAPGQLDWLAARVGA